MMFGRVPCVIGVMLGLCAGASSPWAAETEGQAAPASTPTGFLNKVLPTAGGARRYVLYVPFEYTADKPWPLMVFLHGAGERGDDGLIQSEVGIGSAIRRHPERFPALVLMPQCPKDEIWDAALEEVERAMAQTQADYNIDPQRIYLTGLSMGGYATWVWGAQKADTFAALMPICGGGNLLDMLTLSESPIKRNFGSFQDRVKQLAQVPIYAFHGADDEVVPPARSQQMVKLVKEAGGKVKYKEFAKTGHNAWDQAYASEDAIKWLFKQKKP